MPPCPYIVMAWSGILSLSDPGYSTLLLMTGVGPFLSPSMEQVPPPNCMSLSSTWIGPTPLGFPWLWYQWALINLWLTFMLLHLQLGLGHSLSILRSTLPLHFVLFHLHPCCPSMTFYVLVLAVIWSHINILILWPGMEGIGTPWNFPPPHASWVLCPGRYFCTSLGTILQTWI